MKPRPSGVREFGQTSLPPSFFSKSRCCSSSFSDLSYFDCFLAVVFLSDLEDFLWFVPCKRTFPEFPTSIIRKGHPTSSRCHFPSSWIESSSKPLTDQLRCLIFVTTYDIYMLFAWSKSSCLEYSSAGRWSKPLFHRLVLLPRIHQVKTMKRAVDSFSMMWFSGSLWSRPKEKNNRKSPEEAKVRDLNYNHIPGEATIQGKERTPLILQVRKHETSISSLQSYIYLKPFLIQWEIFLDGAWLIWSLSMLARKM